MKLVHLHNFTFQGLPDINGLVVVIFDALVSIAWESCSNITVSSIVFTKFTSSITLLSFTNTVMAQLYNISIANSNITVKMLSSIWCYQSEVVVSDCNFIGIQGLFGSAMFILKSKANFTGNNIFIDNTASYGGSSYLYKSKIILNGRNIFAYNKATTNSNYTRLFKGNRFVRGSGGAIYSKASMLTINHASIFMNNSAQYNGGSIAAEDGHIFVKRSCILKFERNAAPYGGAVAVYNVTSLLYGRVLFINNKATVGGGTLMMYSSGIQLGSKTAMHRRIMDSSNLIFLGNEAREGGAIKGISSVILIVVDVYFINNRAFLHGGAMFLEGSSRLMLSPAVNTTCREQRRRTLC